MNELSKTEILNLISIIKQHYISFKKSLIPFTKYEKLANEFWTINYEDFFCFAVFLSVTLSIWVATEITGGIKSILAYWDGPNYVFAAMTLYDISQKNPWTKYFNYKPDYFACHLPGFPLIIRIFSFFTCSNYEYADYLSILFCNFLLVYVFRRFLIVYRCVSNPLFTTCLISIIPLRLALYHSVTSSEPLFISYVCLSFIFYKVGNFSLMIIAVWLCVVTRIEGMAIGLTIGLCYLLRLDVLKALSMFLTFIPIILLLFFHHVMFGDIFAYIHFNSDNQHLIGFPPFSEIIYMKYNFDILYIHSYIDFFIPIFIGLFALFKKVGPAAIFASVYIIYISLLNHLDIYRYSIPASIFIFPIGFDVFWSSPCGKKLLFFLLPFYFIFILSYAAGQIHSNRCDDNFFDEVFNANKEVLH